MSLTYLPSLEAMSSSQFGYITIYGSGSTSLAAASSYSFLLFAESLSSFS